MGACRSLKDLYFTVYCTDFASFESTATSLSSLLSLHTLTLSCASASLLFEDAPQHLHFAVPPRFRPVSIDVGTMYPFLRCLHDGINAALGALLVRGMRAHDVQIEGSVRSCYHHWETVSQSEREDWRIKR